MFRKPLLIATMGLIFIFAPQISSAEYSSVVSVTEMHESPNGDCMVKLSKPVGGGLNCSTEWVSFSCTGNFNSKDVAYHKFDLARDAFLNNDYVLTLGIDDARKEQNKYCFVESVTLSKPTSKK
jgi:hypothetical protein